MCVVLHFLSDEPPLLRDWSQLQLMEQQHRAVFADSYLTMHSHTDIVCDDRIT